MGVDGRLAVGENSGDDDGTGAGFHARTIYATEFRKRAGRSRFFA